MKGPAKTAKGLASEIDRLYQASPKDFIAARKALAKTLSGADRTLVESSAKPSVAAWAANQLFWQERATYDELTKAAEQLRAAHRAVIGGRQADVRAASVAHRAAIEQASGKVREIFERAPLPFTAATWNSVARTLEALPTTGAPGRLTVALEPAGFEIFAGIKPRADLRLVPHADPKVAPKVASRPAPAIDARKARAAAAARERLVQGARQTRDKAQERAKLAESRLREAQDQENRQRKLLDRAIEDREARARELEEATRSAKEADRKLTEVQDQ